MSFKVVQVYLSVAMSYGKNNNEGRQKDEGGGLLETIVMLSIDRD